MASDTIVGADEGADAPQAAEVAPRVPPPPLPRLADDEDSTIVVGIAEIDAESELTLNGAPASAFEKQRVRQVIELLRGILPRAGDELEAANLYFEIGELSGWPLGESAAALDAMREASRRRPNALQVARGYRKAALREAIAPEVVTALDLEAQATESPVARALLQAERARMLEQLVGLVSAARNAYEQALSSDPGCVTALMAMERLARTGAERADWALSAVEACGDPLLRAEHMVVAARHLEREGQLEQASALAERAQETAPASPFGLFALERLHAARGAWAELVALRTRQIEAGLVDAAQGWFDVGVLARYRLRDRRQAIDAFRAAAAASEGPAAAACYEELSALYELEQRWREVVEIDLARVPLEESMALRAALWHRIARVHEDRLGQEEEAIEAYEKALGHDPSYVPALESAGRLYFRLGSTERLLRMHRLEAEGAASPSERGEALRRAGELLIRDAATIEEGIETLRAALDELPGNLATFDALERALARREQWRELVALYQAELERTEDRARRGWLLEQIGMLSADRLGDRAAAMKALREARAYDEPRPSAALLRLAELAEDAGDLEVLREALEATAAQTSESARLATVLERLAGVLERLGRPNEAIACYQRAIASAPPSHPVYATAGRAFLRAGRYEELLEVLRAGSRSGPPAAQAMWLQKVAAVSARHLGRVDEAVESLRRALELAPESVSARLMLAELLVREERWADLRAFHESDGGDGARAALRRGMLAEASGDDLAAVALYEQASSAGVDIARVAWSRLAAARQLWPRLREHYEDVAGSHAAMVHARCRGAEIACEHLDDAAAATARLEALRATGAAGIGPLLMLVRIGGASPAPELLAELERTTTCAATQLALKRWRAQVHEAAGAADQALALRREVLELHPSEPVVSVQVELALERASDRLALAELLAREVGDAQLDRSLRGSRAAALGSVLEQLGRARDALDAFERAAEAGSGSSRAMLLAQLRCYGLLQDGERQRATLVALADTLPVGPERAVCLRALAESWLAVGATEEAIEALDAALRANPGDYTALQQLALLLGEADAPRLLDALSRAFEQEEQSHNLVPLGNALAARLLRLGKLQAASGVVDRVAAFAPDDLRSLLLQAEIQERSGSWREAAGALEAIAGHDQADTGLRLEALRRLGALQAGPLAAPERAVGTAQRLGELSGAGVLGLRLRLELEERAGSHERAVATLEALAAAAESEAARSAYLLRLASIHEEKLGDPSRAIETLGRVGTPEQRERAVARLLELGEKTGRWDLASSALEASLASGGAMAPSWEVAIRRRLALLLRDHLGRPEAALPHYQRIAELDPADLEVLELLATATADGDPARAVDYHRRLLAAYPGRIESYRALRRLFLAIGDDDGAFCAEGVLVGLGLADEEEAYFHKQRRTRHAMRLSLALDDEDRACLLPERDVPALALCEVLEEVLADVFPIDVAGYGLDGGGPAISDALGAVVERVAHFIRVGRPRVALVAPRLGPAVELGAPPLLVLPRSLEDAVRREQQFVAGALGARIALHGIALDQKRHDPIVPRHLEYLIGAACELVLPDFHAPFGGLAIFADLKRRLDRALAERPEGAGVRERLRVLAGRMPAELDGAALRDTVARAAARCAIVCACDPAVAVACLRSHGDMFDEEGALAGAPLGPNALAALPFVVSSEHAHIRSGRLGGES